MIDPSNFVTTIDNPYWPAEARHDLPLQGRSRDDATDRRRDRDESDQDDHRYPVHVVNDTVSEHGKPVERTLDYYAQDK